MSSLASGLLQSEEGRALADKSERRTVLNKLKGMLVQGPFALKTVCFLACAICCVVNVLAALPFLFTFDIGRMVVNVYAIIFSFIGCILELGPCLCTRRCLGWLEHWVKLFSRVSGRGILYLILGGMSLASIRSGDSGLYQTIGTIDGICLIVCAIFSLCVSYYAKKKLNDLHSKMVLSHQEDVVYCKQMFNKYDTDHNGALDKPELAAVAKELGSEFTSNELVAIFRLLDEDASGKIEFKEFEDWWTGRKELAKYGVSDIDDKSIEAEYQQLLKSMGLGSNNNNKRINKNKKKKKEKFECSSADLGFSEKELSDPVLAAALEAAGVLSTTKKAEPITRKSSGDIIASMGLSEKDLQDPELINELKAMGYVEKKKQKKQIINQQIPVQQAKKVASSLEIKMNEYKTKALNAKKSGNIPNAKEYYKQYKMFKEQFEQQQQEQHKHNNNNVMEEEEEKTKKISKKQRQLAGNNNNNNVQIQSNNNNKKKKLSPNQATVNLDSLKNSQITSVKIPSVDEADIDNIELNDEDMMDPDLLNELKAMGYVEEEENNKEVMKKKISAMPSPPVQSKETDLVTRSIDLEKEMNEYKTKALNAKKNGDIPNAKKFYSQFKSLREQLEKNKSNTKTSSVVVTSKQKNVIVATTTKGTLESKKKRNNVAPLMNETDIDNIELNDEDMMDPDLLNELKAMGYNENNVKNVENDISPPKQQQHHQQQEQQLLPPPPPYEYSNRIEQSSALAPPPPYVGKEDNSNNMKSQNIIKKKNLAILPPPSTTTNINDNDKKKKKKQEDLAALLQDIEEKMNVYKKKALAFKKQGNLKDAKSNYAQYKRLKSMLEDRKPKAKEVVVVDSKPITKLSSPINTTNISNNKSSITMMKKASDIIVKKKTTVLLSPPKKKAMDNIRNVKLTADDMNDPELLAELKMLQGGGDLLDIASKKQPKQPPVVDVKQLKLEISDNKIKAVEARRSGDMTLARKYYNEYKRLQKVISDKNEN